MHLHQLAKDHESGRVGCPSVHRDAHSGAALVQGHGVVLVPAPADGHATVRIKASIVREALADRAVHLDVHDGAELVVRGDEFDVSLLPNPLPGERAVWATFDDLLAGLAALADDVRPDTRAAP